MKNELAQVTPEYREWLGSLKERIRQSQIKAALKVNSELLGLYWELGRDIANKQLSASWGDGFLAKVSRDLQKSFPGMKGFSVQNLKHMRYWYRFYSENSIGLQVVTHLDDVLARLTQIPWGHNQRIMYKCQDVNEAMFYVQKTIEHGWSRSVLEHQIASELYLGQGKSVNNFQLKLPEPQSDLAQQTLKDPYNFDFLTLREQYNEKEMEDALVNQITQFLLELGTGFSYMGRQFKLRVGESDFFLDLLFYHVKLRCYVVVELKTEKFRPEFAGKLNFYVTAVNKNIRSELDEQTIGILICKDKDNVVAEYSLENISQPIGITEYQLKAVLGEKFESNMPTIEEIENELADE